MCILLKLDYAKFGVSYLFFQKLPNRNLWGSAQPPSPLVKEGLKQNVVIHLNTNMNSIIALEMIQLTEFP